MSDRHQKETKPQETLRKDGPQTQEKTESKAGRIVRLVLGLVFGLGFLVFFIILVVKKCSGQI